MGKILELPKSSSHLLTSTQIITSVFCIVKELIENALDSSAKNVEIKLEDYGVERIEVKDNGCGIDKNDIPFVAKSHFTSKISTYSDLDKVYTYGFRGEALGAVCAVADLVITTKSSEESIGSVSNFGHDGQVISTKPCPCVQGTTVSVLNLFKNIPVRKQFYRSEKNKKEELRKVEDLLISYGCIQHGIRFALYHNRNLIWQKSAVSSPKNALIQILGNSVMDHMAFIDYLNEQTQTKLELYLPKLNAPSICGSNTSSRCITAVNQRPVRIKALDKLLKEYYNKSIQNLGKARYPICFISVTVPLMEVDVNIEPNKTSVMLHNSEEILAQLSKLLKSFYCCDRVTEDNPNVNNIPNKNPSMGKEEISNASDFLTSLKTNCELKTQQSKLNFVTDCVKITNNRQVDNSLQKEDITRISEPCKKKLKTNIRSTSKDINSHIATLRDFFANEDENNSNHAQHASDSIANASRVTVQRNCGNENISKISGDLSNVSDASDSITSASRVTVQRNCGIENISKISGDLSNVSDASDSITNAPRVTVQRNCGFENISKISGDLSNVSDASDSIANAPRVTVQRNCGIENISKVSGDLSNVSNVHCDKITTFAVSSNLCTKNANNSSVSFQDKNISDTSAQFLRDFDGSNRNSFGINRSFSSVNDTCSERITLPLRTNLNTDHPIPAEESCTSNSCVSSVKCNESAIKNSVISNNGQNGDLWSRGIHPSEEFVQPVAVLQPKVTTTSESNQRQANNVENCKKSSPNNQKNLSFERKLTAFDIFCRSNRLEVAAQNPEFSNHQIAQILSEKWNRLSSEEKAVYKNMLNKDYRKDIKKKERLGRTISQNLSQDKKEVSICKKLKKKQFKQKLKNKDIKCNIEEIRSCFLNKDSCKKHIEDMNIINALAPGIWVCTKADKLIFLNTFRLQETIIYHRLLETFQFDTEPLEAPVYIPTSHLGNDAMTTLMDMNNLESNNDGIISQFLIPNGFDVRLIKDDNNETAVELLGITKVIAFYGISDLKEILLLIKEKGCSTKLSECRPGKIILYLQSEANRMCRRSPACQRIQDVKDLLLQKESLLVGCSVCIHHKPFCQEIWDVQRNEKCTE